MRITDKTTATNAVFNINQGRIKIDRLNEKISSGFEVNRPSDNPVATKKLLDLESQIKTSNQYISNIKTGKNWLDMVGVSLEGTLDTLMSIKGTGGQALAGINDPVKKTEMLDQLKFFRQQLIDYSTSQVGNQYVFSGFKSNTAPFAPASVTADITAGSPAITNIDTTDLYPGLPISGPGIPANSTVTAITTPGVGGAITISNAATATTAGISMTFTGRFQGTDDIVNIEVNQGLQLPVSVSGGALLRGGTPPGSSGVDIIKTLDTLIMEITNDNTAGIKAANLLLDTANQEMLSVISDVGMRKARMDNALTAQQRNNNILSKMHEDLQNVDYAQRAIELTQEKTAFEAALSATAKIAPLSLLNYLR